MPLAIRFGMVASVMLAVVLFGAKWGAGTPAFADVDAAISEQGAVRIQVEIDMQMPNTKHQEKRTIYASTKPLRLRTETVDGNIEILDIAAGRRLLIEPEKKMATLHLMSAPGAKAPKSLLEALQVQFQVDAKGEVNREQLNGQDVLVYRTDQPTPTMKSRIKQTMWVNPRTKLPVKTQGDVVSSDPKMSQFYSRVVMSDFQWNPPEASKMGFFSTEPPSGFEVKTIDLRTPEPRQELDSASPSKE